MSESDLVLSKSAVVFSDTTVWMKPASFEGGKLFRELFGEACMSVELRKSGLLYFERIAENRGLSVRVDMTWSGE